MRFPSVTFKLTALSEAEAVAQVAIAVMGHDQMIFQAASAGKLGGAKPITGKHGGASHDARIRAFSVVIDTPLDRYGLQSALSMLTSFRAENLLRFKAIVNLRDEPRPAVLHGVQHVLYPEVTLDAWPDDDHRSRFVFIVRDLEPEFVAKLLADFAGAAQNPGGGMP